jgi:hypothetical protein
VLLLLEEAPGASSTSAQGLQKLQRILGPLRVLAGDGFAMGLLDNAVAMLEPEPSKSAFKFAQQVGVLGADEVDQI